MHAKDLNKEAPRSPKELMGGFAIVARTIDKCRANIAGTNNGYHFNCPLDRMLFDFKGTDAEVFKQKAADGASDEELLQFVKETGTPKTDEEIAAWTESSMAFTYHGHPEKGEWFDGECVRLGLDPAATTLFDYLDEDDKQSYV